MSIDNERTGKPSTCLKCEGCQEQTGQPPQSVQRSGGVSGDGMPGGQGNPGDLRARGKRPDERHNLCEEGGRFGASRSQSPS